MNLSILRRFTCCVLVVLVCLTSTLSAQNHVVNPTDLQKEVLAATGARQRNMESITGFLSSTAEVQKVLGSFGIDPAQVKTAVSSLDDQELARMAVRAEKAQADFAAGRLSDRDLLYVVLGIAVLVLIIVAVR